MSRLGSILILFAVAGCSPPPAPTAPKKPEADDASPPKAGPVESPDRALNAGVLYLLKQQSPDGAWRSDVYATFKDGTALTPLAVCALQAAGADAKAARKGCEFLAKLAKADGTIDPGPDGLDYPVYTAALSVIALSHPENKDLAKARDAWLKYLLDRQLTEKLGWQPEDKEYGGWGYCRVPPKKPVPNTVAPPLIESNLSATAFALDALKAAGVTDKAVFEKALVFVRRCQNWAPPVPSANALFVPPDGGFHFIYDDPVRNKAGSPDPPGGPLTRFHSYGSTTADGLRALLHCGEPEAQRVASAREWLVKNFKADTHPGTYIPAHERNREAVYYYYAASAARTLRLAGVKEAGGTDWANALATELAKRQTADGSWANPVELVRENDPIVATCNAVLALASK